ncbi:hypothetical protein [Streptomyces xanthophaeus]|uniref:Uncharacterized protein n=1 Tax=Streptomyces xanthophaeus TaxID=67385 RepID=A0A919GTK1_9ACTN|nr:hypothetical protein [Streptomyces xanthophaeus]GHI84136.1 hypothetical protein Sxan_15000 [Streptomyces xanthophaeus]
MAVAEDGADRKVDFPPVDNGLDYLLSVVHHLAPRAVDTQPTARELKYAVLHLQAAVEVLLKARLLREHWSLVFSRVDVKDATKQNFKQGNFSSTTPEETVRRLREIAGLKFAKADLDAMTALVKDRNALQHYGLTASAEAIESRAAEVLDFLIRFLDEQLLPGLESDERARSEADMVLVRQGLVKIRSFVSTRMARLERQLTPRLGSTVECPACRQMAYVIQEGKLASCLFCTHQPDGCEEWDGFGVESQLAAIEYAGRVLGTEWKPGGKADPSDPFTDPSTPPVERCLTCGDNAVVLGARIALHPERDVAFCFACTRKYDRCEECRNQISPDGYPYDQPYENEKLCRKCFHFKLQLLGVI